MYFGHHDIAKKTTAVNFNRTHQQRRQLAGPKVLEHMVDTVLQFEATPIYVPDFTVCEKTVLVRPTNRNSKCAGTVKRNCNPRNN
jgi:hypothetical protein